VSDEFADALDELRHERRGGDLDDDEQEYDRELRRRRTQQRARREGRPPQGGEAFQAEPPEVEPPRRLPDDQD
jgi:hypothetical protein